jgi:hypothetical protein
MTRMGNRRVRIHSFLKHLLEKKFSRAHKDLEYVIEQKLRNRAAAAKMKSKTKVTAKATPKTVAKKEDSSKEEEK